MSEKPTDKKFAPPQLPPRGEPIRVKSITFDASQATTITWALVNSLTYDPKHPQNQYNELWYLPAISSFWIKSTAPKYIDRDPIIIHAARATGWSLWDGGAS